MVFIISPSFNKIVSQEYRNLSGKTNDTLYNLMIKGSPAESAYNQLSAAIIAHNKRPSFAYNSSSAAASNQITLKYDAATNSWAATLTDANSVLSGYNVTSNGGLSVSKSGNNLVVSTKSELNGAASIQLARPLPGTGQALLTLYSSSSQNALIGQLQDPVTSYLSVKTEDIKGKVSVNKVGENGDKLSGVVFGVYADSACANLLTKITTGNDGSGVSAGIDVGTSGSKTVYVKEFAITAEQQKLYSMNNTVYPVSPVRLCPKVD